MAHSAVAADYTNYFSAEEQTPSTSVLDKTLNNLIAWLQ